MSIPSAFLVSCETYDGHQVANQRLAQLESLLSKSAKYVELLKEQMDQVRAKNSRPRAKPKSVVKPMSTTKSKSVANSQRKRTRLVSDSEDEREPKRVKAGDKAEENEDDVTETPKSEQPSFQQPALVTGATLKDYQLEGVAWMAGLHSNGLSGILGRFPSLPINAKCLTAIQPTKWVLERWVGELSGRRAAMLIQST